MSDIDEILKAVPLDEVASDLGVDRATAEQATRAAIPTLLAGLQANAADPDGAASLASALGSHDNGLASSASLADIDTDDGQKIVNNIFGSNKDAVVSTLADAPAAGALGGGALKQLLPKLLPILAPIVLSWLAKKYSGGQGGGLMAILQSILGGASGQSGGTTGGATGSGGGIGDILGDLLGGGGADAKSTSTTADQPGAKEPESGGLGGLGSILGDLLGGGKR